MVFLCMHTIILIMFTLFSSCLTHVDPSLFPMSSPIICIFFFGDSMRLIAYNSTGNLPMTSSLKKISSLSLPLCCIICFVLRMILEYRRQNLLEYRRQHLSPHLILDIV